MRIVDETYFDKYFESFGDQLIESVRDFIDSNQDLDLGYQTTASAVFSSNIEGNSLDLNSFMNYSISGNKLKATKDIQEIADLIAAYDFAQNNLLNENNFLHCHKLSSSTLLIKSKRGKYRNDSVGVFGAKGLVYLAIEPEFVPEFMSKLFKDISQLLQQEMDSCHVFYFASMLHLRFVHIHPFRDGNGRMARLLEKWFVTQKLGDEFWKLSSEKFYKEHQLEYYGNIDLGVNFYELDYLRCLPFLLMLPKSI